MIVAIVSPIVWECAKSFIFKEERDYRAIIRECEELSRICREVIEIARDSNNNSYNSMKEVLGILKEHGEKIEELSAAIKH